MDKAKLLKDVSSLPPRFGGYLKIKEELHPNAKFTTQFRRHLVDYKNIYPISVAKDWNLDKHSQEMITMLISCVMKMASKKINVSDIQLDLLDKYLKSIKYNSLHDLPNVNGILKYLSAIRGAPKILNQFGDYTYVCKHNKYIYSARSDVKKFKRCPNVDFNKKDVVLPSLANYNNYMSKLEMALQNNSFRELQKVSTFSKHTINGDYF